MLLPQTAPALRHRGHTAGADDSGSAHHGDGGAPAAEAEQDQGQGRVLAHDILLLFSSTFLVLPSHLPI